MSDSAQGRITHFGAVDFDGAYKKIAGSDNWKVWPIEGFDPPIRAPVGQVRIDFSKPVEKPYTVLVTACRNLQVPLIAANYGDVDENGFVVHIWESIADRTLVNAGFSFAVIQ